MLSKTELKENLSRSFAKIVFNKSDGSTRIMNCTLISDFLPEKILDEGVRHVPHRENDEVLAVWDLDNKGWRSFNVNSVLEVQYIGVENAASA